MINFTHSILIVAILALVTMAIRFAPFVVFRKNVPAPIQYLGKYLPFAIIAMLVVYCLKSVTPLTGNHAIPEIIGVCLAAGLHKWKRNILLTIIVSTAAYMILLRILSFS